MLLLEQMLRVNMAWIFVLLLISGIKADRCEIDGEDATGLLHVGHSREHLAQNAAASELATTMATTTGYGVVVCEQIQEKLGIPSLCIPYESQQMHAPREVPKVAKATAKPAMRTFEEPGLRQLYGPWDVEKEKAKAGWKVDVAKAKAKWWCEKQPLCHDSPPHLPDCPITSAGSRLFSDRASFEALLTVHLFDGYDNAGYFSGDTADAPFYDSFSDAGMSAVVGETQYTSTGFQGLHMIVDQDLGDPVYCSGCNGAYRLSFQRTSVGTAEGVFAVGFDMVEHQTPLGTVAFVTYGDGSTDEFVLPERQTVFWGIMDCRRIASIHFGLSGGVPNTDDTVQRMAHDNLTIGA